MTKKTSDNRIRIKDLEVAPEDLSNKQMATVQGGASTSTTSPPPIKPGTATGINQCPTCGKVHFGGKGCQTA